MSAQNPLLSFTEKARVLTLACKAPVLSASVPLSSFCCSLHSSLPGLLAISKTYCHLRTFTPVTAFLQKALPQTDECKFPSTANSYQMSPSQSCLPQSFCLRLQPLALPALLNSILFYSPHSRYHLLVGVRGWEWVSKLQPLGPQAGLVNKVLFKPCH